MMAKPGNLLLRLLVGLWLPIALVLVWWFASGSSTSVFFPPLKDILANLSDDWFARYWSSDVVPSLIHFVLGFVIAAVLGATMGILLGLNSRVRRNVSPVTEFCRSLPIAALLPPALIIIGAGAGMETALIAFGCFWPILMNAADGVRNVEPVALENARIYGLSRSQRVRQIVLPYTLPAIFAGMRIAVAIGLTIMVVATMIGSSSGLGYVISRAQTQFDLPAVWAGVIVAAIIGVAANLLLSLAQRLSLGWYEQWRAATDSN